MELQLMVPTYNGALYGQEVMQGKMPDFGAPFVPVVVRPAEGLRIVLGTTGYGDAEKPDVQIERQPNGWVIFLHPLAGCDPCGYIYFLDDGRAFLHKERCLGPTEGIDVLEANETLPEIYGRP